MASRSLHSRARAWQGSRPPARRPIPPSDPSTSSTSPLTLDKDVGSAFSPFESGIQIQHPVTDELIWYDLDNWMGEDAEDARDAITDDIGDDDWEVMDATDNFLAPGAEVNNDNFDSLFNQYRVFEEYGRDGFELAECFGLDTSGAWDFDEIQSQYDDRYFCDEDEFQDRLEELTEDQGDIPESIKYYIDYEAMARDALMDGSFTQCGDKIFFP